jgi:competence protein ComEC
MSSVFLLAELAGRQKSGGPALFLAAAVMAGANPGVLWDVSFQLSFLAMCGLVYVYPPLGEYGKDLTSRLPEKLKSPLASITDSLAVSLAATAAVWPALAVYFGSVALAGPVATVLAAPALPPVIVLSLFTALTGLVSPTAALIPGALAWLLISYIMLVAGAFAHFPVVGASNLNAAVAAGYYALLAAFLWWLNRIKRRRFAAGLAGL